MSTLNLLAIGEVMAELRRGSTQGFAVGFAGDTFNTAVYCARELGNQPKVAYLTRLGADPLSDDLIDIAKAEHIDVSGIGRDADKNIGIYAVSTDEHGERSFSYWRADSAARQLFREAGSEATLPAADIVYLSGITLAIMSPDARTRLRDHLAMLSSSGKSLIAFDSNYRPNLWEDQQTARHCIGEMWSIADIALPSIDDEMALFGDQSEDAVIKRFSQQRYKACAIKRGEQGPYSPTADLPALRFDHAAQVVDTTAAGDSFNGGYLAAYIKGLNEADCLSNGHCLASKVIGCAGAIIPR